MINYAIASLQYSHIIAQQTVLLSDLSSYSFKMLKYARLTTAVIAFWDYVNVKKLLNFGLNWRSIQNRSEI